MITKVHYKNFKALRDSTLPLGRFTLIVGANGTGKTTAMRGIELIAQPNLKKVSDIATFKNLNEVHIEVHKANGTNTKIGLTLVDAGNGGIKIQEGLVYDNKVITDYEFRQKILNPLKQFRIFSFDANAIAMPVTIKPEMQLGVNGSNLAGVLDQLQDDDDERFNDLNAELNRWFPEYDRILFETPREGTKAFLLRTKIGKHKIKAADLSHGTLLSLAYLAVAYLPNPPKIVCFEEPERGIHPRLLRSIQEAMDRLAYPENFGEKREPVQVIATTHSPYLLDLYKDRREEIVIADKDEDSVHFNRLIDLPHIEEILKEQDAPLGDIWFSGILGGVPA